jgi:polar amino acid transport system substrate-binding protein
MMSMTWVRNTFLLALIFGLDSCVACAETVTVYTNATFPPLVLNTKIGLYPELVEYLNQLKIKDLQFKLKILPRKRLQSMLENETMDGIVIGMMPQWLDDATRTRYLWTDVFSVDSFVLVSAAKNPVFFDQIDAKDHLKIGVTFGYVYPGIDEWIAEHKLIRDDAPTEERNIDKLMLGRVDTIVVTESVLRYYTKTHHMNVGIIIESLPGQQTERRFVIPKSKQGVFEKLTPAIRNLSGDSNWKRIQAQY